MIWVQQGISFILSTIFIRYWNLCNAWYHTILNFVYPFIFPVHVILSKSTNVNAKKHAEKSTAEALKGHKQQFKLICFYLFNQSVLAEPETNERSTSPNGLGWNWMYMRNFVRDQSNMQEQVWRWEGFKYWTQSQIKAKLLLFEFSEEK